MAWQKDPFQNVLELMRTAATALAETQNSLLLNLQQQIESSMRAASQHDTLKMEVNTPSQLEIIRARKKALAEAQRAHSEGTEG